MVGFLAADVAFLVPDAVGFEEATIALTVLGTLAEVFFDFDATVTQSMTLYAKWSDDEGREIIADLDEGETVGFKPVIAGLACVFILGGSIAGAILFVRKGGKHEKEQ